ncbi:TadE/TadG family type IV pilus assembly protein [Methylobacterium sp. J-092]|uniref:TadE/TadG family type IV pilus assembly protein n=1 Tax=Methylobacterium sp. J-092 TaxID=2836667 RepID=UPI0024453800|nr:pilus assembly protein [Methylobacterium sp. J-092]
MRGPRTFLHARGGATAVEFALVAPMLLLMIAFVMAVALVMFVNQRLDYATSQAARQVMIGKAKINGIDQATFKTALCSRLPAVMSCGNVVVNLYKVQPTFGAKSGYYAFVKPDVSGLLVPSQTSGSGQYDLGNAGDYQYLQVIYPISVLPSVFASMLGTDGSTSYLAISTAAFRNEKF